MAEDISINIEVDSVEPNLVIEVSESAINGGGIVYATKLISPFDPTTYIEFTQDKGIRSVVLGEERVKYAP